LAQVGTPSGNKVTQPFLVPEWIKANIEFSREYLRTAYDCEGSIWKEYQWKIRFGIFKEESLLGNGFEFIEDLKFMLAKFGVFSTKTWIMKGNIRKDGKITKGLYFKIKQGSLTQFASQIGFSNKFKKQRLSTVSGYLKDGII